MKKILLSIMLVMFAFAPVAHSQGMSEADMQNMMQLMQKMQECMAKVDKAELEGLEQEAEKMEAEIKALCEQGKKKEAQKKAIAYSKDMMENPALVQMKKCGEMTKGLIPEGSMPQMEEEEDFGFDPSKGHVCDDMNL